MIYTCLEDMVTNSTLTLANTPTSFGQRKIRLNCAPSCETESLLEWEKALT